MQYELEPRDFFCLVCRSLDKYTKKIRIKIATTCTMVYMLYKVVRLFHIIFFNLHINLTDVAEVVFDDVVVLGAVKPVWFGALLPHSGFGRVKGHCHHSGDNVGNQHQSRDLE